MAPKKSKPATTPSNADAPKDVPSETTTATATATATATSAPSSFATSSTPIIGWGNLLDKYKPKEGSWKCVACMLINDPDLLYCRACERDRQGKAKATDPTPEISSATPLTSANAAANTFTNTFTSTADAAAVLFGSSASSTNFGSASSTFGSTSSAFGSTSSAFGSTSSTFGSTSSAFGSTSTTNAASILFGASSSTPAADPAVLFGSTAATTTTSASAIVFGSTQSSFGATPTPTPTPTLTSASTSVSTSASTSNAATSAKTSKKRKAEQVAVHDESKAADAGKANAQDLPDVSIPRRVELTRLTPRTIACDVFTVGGGECGQLGHGPQLGIANHPKKVATISSQLKMKAYDGACGPMHTILFALPADSSATQIPSVSASFLSVTQAVEKGSKISAAAKTALTTRKLQSLLSADSSTTAKSDSDETVRWTLLSWGCNDDHALGRPEADENFPAPISLPREISLLRMQVVQISCGDCHSALLTDAGLVYTWGTYRNDNGPVGYAPGIAHQETPRRVSAALDGVFVTQIASGAHHTIALAADGRVFTWGDGHHGQLGHRFSLRGGKDALREALVPHRPIDFPSTAYPTTASTPTGEPAAKRSTAQSSARSPIVRIYAGPYHNMAIAQNGAVFGWGLNNHGQLAIGNRESTIVPVRLRPVEALSPVHIALGNYTSVFVAGSGEVFAAGRGDAGQLGCGVFRQKIEPQETPVRVKFPFSFRQGDSKAADTEQIDWVEDVHARGDHFLAITHRGNLYAWGAGEMSQLANASTDVEGDGVMHQGADEPAPIAIASRGRRVSVALAGSMHTVILASASVAAS